MDPICHLIALGFLYLENNNIARQFVLPVRCSCDLVGELKETAPVIGRTSLYSAQMSSITLTTRWSRESDPTLQEQGHLNTNEQESFCTEKGENFLQTKVSTEGFVAP